MLIKGLIVIVIGGMSIMSQELTTNNSQSFIISILSKQSEINVLETQIALMKNKLKSLEREQQDLENTVIAFMKNSKLKSVETTDYKVTLKEPSTVRVEIVDEKLIPQEYFRVKTETSVNKEKLKVDLKDGKEIPGCTLALSDPSLSIKDKGNNYE